MKRFFLCGVLLGLALCFAGCSGGEEQGNTEPSCPHTYTEWLHDEKVHYQICPLCGQRHDEEEHRFIQAYGQAYSLKTGDASAIVRVFSEEKGASVKEIWVYTGPSAGTLRVSRAATENGGYYSFNDLVLDGLAGWKQVPLEGEISLTSYPFFRLTAIGEEISVREIAFLGGEEGGELSLLNAESQKGALLDCRQFPGARRICRVCEYEETSGSTRPAFSPAR